MTDVLIASVVMPERGTFFVRCPDELSMRDEDRGRRVVVSLDYGVDVGEVASAAPYDPSQHGQRIPGFRLERFIRDSDVERLAENEKLAESMGRAFEESARADVQGLKVLSARLSLGRTRLFVRFVADQRRPDLARAVGEMKRGFGVSVNAWQMGPRDEVACMGALGPCGRVCCCASWQKRFPAKITVPEGTNPAAVNGVCGRFKCCLNFESFGE